MAQGLWVNGVRPRSKRAVKEALKAGQMVVLEKTGLSREEYHGNVNFMPEGRIAFFVGPDPYAKRDFYGQIVRRGSSVTVT